MTLDRYSLQTQYGSYKSHRVNHQELDKSVLFSVLFQSVCLFTAGTYACVQHVSCLLETLLLRYSLQGLLSHLTDRESGMKWVQQKCPTLHKYCWAAVCTRFCAMHLYELSRKKGPKQMSYRLVANHYVSCFKDVLTELTGILAIHRLVAWPKPGPICNGNFEPGLNKFILHSFLPKQHSLPVQLYKLLMLILSIIDSPRVLNCIHQSNCIYPL